MKPFLSQAATRLKRKILALLQIGAAHVIVYWVFKLRAQLRVDRSGMRGMKPPFIVLGNHTSNFDPALVQHVISPYPCYFLTSNYYFRLPIVRQVLNIFGAIPKIQFYPDIRSARMMVEAISRGDAVGIFPEGRRSIDGKCCPIPDSVAKLIKKFKVPVVSVRTRGGYFIWPRWSSFWRSGSVETVAKPILTTEEICKMDVQEIYDIICQALTYNDYEWNRTARENYYHKNAAERLHLVLHQCPRCFAERTMRSKGIRLYCSACGNTAVIDESGFLQPLDGESVIFDDPVKWNAWQRNNMLALLRDDRFTIHVKVKDLRIADKYYGEYRSCGYGEIILNKDGMRFWGPIDGRMTELFFPCETMPSISTEFRDDFEICDNINAWWFFLEEEQQTVRMEAAISLLYEQKMSPLRSI
ncbi:MAG TPA: lysophospholipid acyltransferase family protein [Methylomusa anaerophila]|uniref:2-acyl-glycerophospho-ethanolamine acyltransferase n=1 Tax=Methylomusa anaerophila TaxID=1930071 RepID=A0A348ALC4_9FIRM|nr:lysophospholipid acyltransferase family protein [Methylomusa anaerophila]BBB91872.1 2-acyl-glycerophospho-ethanolamine acyltransferase [Methylomusa anaerophila]HML88397.1 lysophospholipid acyltransferase family protein [Methylomusa anaerophila]